MSSEVAPNTNLHGTSMFTRWRDGEPRTRPPSLVEGGTICAPGRSAGAYELGRMLGEGGQGIVFECTHPDNPGVDLAIKFTWLHQTWAHELYFDSVVANHRYALRLIDSFALPDKDVEDGVVFCTVMERAVGDLSNWLSSAARPLTEARAIRAARQILEPLESMHRAGVVHRDVTPWNVFVMADGSMRLADFGIAAQATANKRVSATIFNPNWAPRNVSMARYWTPSLDCWQVGQLLAAMLRGTAASPVSQSDVRSLPCSDETRSIIWRAIGNETQRFGNASEFREALRRRSPVRSSVPSARPSSLSGRLVCFTGRLESMERTAAVAAARRKGAIVRTAVSFETEFLIVGEPSPAYAAGDAGAKLLRARRFNEQGARIRTVSESAFLRSLGHSPK